MLRYQIISFHQTFIFCQFNIWYLIKKKFQTGTQMTPKSKFKKLKSLSSGEKTNKRNKHYFDNIK